MFSGCSDSESSAHKHGCGKHRLFKHAKNSGCDVLYGVIGRPSPGSGANTSTCDSVSGWMGKQTDTGA